MDWSTTLEAGEQSVEELLTVDQRTAVRAHARGDSELLAEFEVDRTAVSAGVAARELNLTAAGAQLARFSWAPADEDVVGSVRIRRFTVLGRELTVQQEWVEPAGGGSQIEHLLVRGDGHAWTVHLDGRRWHRSPALLARGERPGAHPARIRMQRRGTGRRHVTRWEAGTLAAELLLLELLELADLPSATETLASSAVHAAADTARAVGALASLARRRR
ncbi:hypothetical protein D9V37_17150 [Nocardioides mangrovicus]|uniref:Uncharacterized protein n=1 Tax=Nocardioides mangrovicus TaxID=2478913 RepID=A0A3L8NX67_9ACTN|nr:hypothetical protein [Nocardioides mangrovicus]RLV47846.1 hypothetical protein D9V37_17150 [Nocardioides mangrovicus]